MSDEITAVLNSISPNLSDGPKSENKPEPVEHVESDGYDDIPKAKPRPDDFGEDEYENEDDPDFDPDSAPPEQKKAWPKKYRNALAQRKNEITKLRGELAAFKQSPQPPAKAASDGAQELPVNYSPEQKAKLDKIMSDKPLLKDFKDYGEFVEKLTAWNAKVQIAEHNFAVELQTKAREADIAASKNEERITNQSKELIQKHPEYLELVRDNADILAQMDNVPQVKEAFGKAEHPELAFLGLASTPGALQRLMTMNADQAIAFIAKAEMVGEGMISQANGQNPGSDDTDDKPEPQQRSQAPKPLRASKGVSSGRKSADQMTADELDEVLGFSNI